MSAKNEALFLWVSSRLMPDKNGKPQKPLTVKEAEEMAKNKKKGEYHARCLDRGN